MIKLEGLKRQVVVAALIKRLQESDSWAGETHVQKSLYLLDSLGVPANYDFVLYRYGPYSFDLHDDLVDMIATGTLNLESRPPYGPSLKVTARAEKLFESFPKTISQWEKELGFVVRELAEKNVKSLEQLSTALYVTKELGISISAEGRARKLIKLKPHVSFEEAQLAVGDIDKLIREVREAGLQISL